MAKARTLVGLDVHAAKVVAAVLDVETGEVRSFRLPGDPLEAAGFCSGLARPVWPECLSLALDGRRVGHCVGTRPGPQPTPGARVSAVRPAFAAARQWGVWNTRPRSCARRSVGYEA